MNMRMLATLAGPLFLAGTASAGFLGVNLVVKEAPPGNQGEQLFVCNIYAVFDRTDDEMVAVAGTHTNPLDISVVQGKFYQDMQGQPLGPPREGMLPGMSGLLAFDTFITIGVKTQNLQDLSDDFSYTPGLTFDNDRLYSENDAWFIIPNGPGNGGIGAPDANGQVLIFQGSFDVNGGGLGISAAMLLQFTSNGVAGVTQYVTVSHVPGPGAVALLGAAGLLIRRRRR